MNPKTKTSGLFLAASLLFTPPASLASESQLLDLYGELDISRDHIEGLGNVWVSNVSRLGIRGKYNFTDTTNVFYQLEQEVDVVSGGFEQDTLLSIRNTYVGFGTDAGSIILGTHDTPLKKAQGKVDRFNDQLGDIRTLFPGEVRARDSIMYSSPTIGDGFEAKLMYVPPDDEFGNSHSISISYDTGEVTWGFGVDMDMRKNDRQSSQTRIYDSMRGSVEFKTRLWQFGLMAQVSRDDTFVPDSDWEPGYVVSAYRVIRDDFSVSGQYAYSNILGDDEHQTTLGASYFIRKSLRIYGIVSLWRLEDGSFDNVAIGTEWKF